MKALSVLASLLLVLFTSVYGLQNSYAADIEKTINKQQIVVFDMQNMTCAMCKITIRKALEAVEGVQTVIVDFDSKTASVRFDTEKTTIDYLIKATSNAGYPATVQQIK